jgi:hypothetical protein
MRSNRFLNTFFVVIFISLVVFQCDDEIIQDDESAKLEILRLEIENLAQSSICNDSTQCKYIGFGSKPCGGAAGYLIYSTSIDTEKLERLVLNYNNKHAAFNTKWGIISDCTIVNPPTRISCENNTCVAVY